MLNTLMYKFNTLNEKSNTLSESLIQLINESWIHIFKTMILHDFSWTEIVRTRVSENDLFDGSRHAAVSVLRAGQIQQAHIEGILIYMIVFIIVTVGPMSPLWSLMTLSVTY